MKTLVSISLLTLVALSALGQTLGTSTRAQVASHNLSPATNRHGAAAAPKEDPPQWVINNWLLILYTSDHQQYLEWRAAGAEWWACIGWTDGHSHPSNACTDPRPPDPLP